MRSPRSVRRPTRTKARRSRSCSHDRSPFEPLGGYMRLLSKLFAVVAIAATALAVAAPAAAQQKLKWAHVYETSEPFHKWSVWAAQEIEKRTSGRYHIDVFPASSLGKESD